MVYVKYLLAAIRRHGGLRATLITSTNSYADPVVTEILNEFNGLLSVQTVEISMLTSLLDLVHPRLAKQFEFFRILRNVINNILAHTSIDYVFLPFLDDYFLYSLAAHSWPFPRLPFGGISIRPRFHLREMGVAAPWSIRDWIEKTAYRNLIRTQGLDRLFSIDPYLAPYFDSKKIVTVCDPSNILNVTPAHIDFGFPTDAIVLLTYGYLDSRKAIDRLMSAMLDSSLNPRLTLFLAGLQSADVSLLMTGDVAIKLREQGRLVEVNRHFTDAEEAAAFLRADIVWNYYPHNYCSSGALVRAGQLSLPVIATREGLVGDIVSKLNMGITVPEDDDEGLVKALFRLGQDSLLRSELGRGGFEYFSKATAEAFGDKIIKNIINTITYSSFG